MTRSKLLSLGLLAALLAQLGAGCSSFNRAWDKAAALDRSAAGIEGRWVGHWESDKNGHTGALRCIVTHQSNEVYSARFHAKYKRLFNLSFGYRALLEAKSDGTVASFKGEADLGWYAGGVYRYEGHAGGTNFFSTYSCKYDHGKFIMTRPDHAASGKDSAQDR